jgi:hypothetical protein
MCRLSFAYLIGGQEATSSSSLPITRRIASLEMAFATMATTPARIASLPHPAKTLLCQSAWYLSCEHVNDLSTTDRIAVLCVW